MRPALAVLLILSAMSLGAISTRSERWAHPDARDRRLSRQVNTTDLTAAPVAGFVSSSVFRFADSTGTGMGTACACTAVTGTASEAITVTRAGTAYCSKHIDGVLLSNTDLAQCGANLPRVESMTTGGALMLAVKRARTNNAIRSQTLNNASWVKLGVVSAAPTVTTNAATAPDNTVSAEEVSFPSTALAGASVIHQAGACAGTRDSAAVYIKGVSGSGTLQICADTGTLLEANCVIGSYVSTSWTRIAKSNFTGQTRMVIGNITDAVTGTTNPLNDVYLWQTDCQPNTTSDPFVGEPIGTSTAAAADNAENVTFSTPGSMANANGCGGIDSFIYNGSVPIGVSMAFNTGLNALDFISNTSTEIQDATNNVSGTVTAVGGRLARQLGGWTTTGSTLKLYGEVTASGAYDGTIIGATIGLGGATSGAGNACDCLVGNVNLGTTQLGCN